MKDYDLAKLTIALVVFACVVGYLIWKNLRQVGPGRDAARLSVRGVPLSCQVCGNETFYNREGLVNTTWLTFFKLAWLNRSAHCVVCESCGYMHWFITPHDGRSGWVDSIRYTDEEAASPRSRRQLDDPRDT